MASVTTANLPTPKVPGRPTQPLSLAGRGGLTGKAAGPSQGGGFVSSRGLPTGLGQLGSRRETQGLWWRAGWLVWVQGLTPGIGGLWEGWGWASGTPLSPAAPADFSSGELRGAQALGFKFQTQALLAGDFE